MSCPICGSTVQYIFLAKVTLNLSHEYDLVGCPSCEAEFINPIPDAKHLIQFYESGVIWGTDGAKQIGRGYAFYKKYLTDYKGTDKLRFLDVGCASGYFMKGVQDYSGWDCVGVEINQNMAEFATCELGLKVINDDVYSVLLEKEKFDFIHLGDIVEHVSDPYKFLLRCKYLLNERGRIVLSIPNGSIDSLGIKYFYGKTGLAARTPNGHLFFLNKTALSTLFMRTGFNVIESKTYNIKYGLRALGYLPKKDKWFKSHDPLKSLASPNLMKIKDISLRPLWYYSLKSVINHLLMFRGLKSIGLDFEIILGVESK